MRFYSVLKMNYAWKIVRYGGEFVVGSAALSLFFAMMLRTSNETAEDNFFTVFVIPPIIIALLMSWYYQRVEKD